MEFIYIFYLETYKILLLLIPILVSVALIVWFDRESLGFCSKKKRPKCCWSIWTFSNSADALKYILKK